MKIRMIKNDHSFNSIQGWLNNKKIKKIKMQIVFITIHNKSNKLFLIVFETYFYVSY